MNSAEMEAGRELDALVAERVMGWRWMNVTERHPPIMMPPEQWGQYTPEYLESAWAKAYDGNPPNRLPSYSTDIAAAWELVEKMGEKFDGLYPSRDEETGKLFHWVAVTAGRHSRRGHPADTAPLAICRAALATTEAP